MREDGGLTSADYRALAADRLAELGPEGKVAVPVLIARLKDRGERQAYSRIRAAERRPV